MSKIEKDAARLAKMAGGAIDLAIVLGSGLAGSFERAFESEAAPYATFKTLPSAPLAGHPGRALTGNVHGARVLALAGRVHLYQGFSAYDVCAGVRLAQAAGARTIVLTNAAGSLNPDYEPGDLMTIADHINLTGCNPLAGAGEGRFVDMSGAYAPHLREIVRATLAGPGLREGTYVGLSGPSYETAAEARYLRTIGGDAVGMSTVLETIQARALGMDVLGLSVITNAAGAQTGHEAVTAAASGAADRVTEIVSILVDRLAS